MSEFNNFWSQGDAITRLVAVLLLLMSISAWIVIFWKGWLLHRVSVDLRRAVPAFWAAPSLAIAREQLAGFDREGVLRPLVEAAVTTPPAGTLEAHGHADSQLTRRLRDALHGVLAQLQFGQVLLASIGSTAPFIGLFGTVWGVMNSFIGIGNLGNASLAVVAPGIAEALIATAIGLAAAIPAVMAYNYFLRRIRVLESEMDAFNSDYLNIVRRHFLQ